MRSWPNLMYGDIYNYLITSKAVDGEEMKNWPVAWVQCFLLFLYSIWQFHLYSSLLSCYFSLRTQFSTIKLPHDCKKVPNQRI
jgi:hypothetical protein